MTIPVERWLLDTNVWVFGLRSTETSPACAELLDNIGSFSVEIPLQILKELNLNLTEEEIREFYGLINQYPECIELSWQPAPLERVRFFQSCGCRKGDAVVAAHAEALGLSTIVSENRQFLKTLDDLPLTIINAATALSRIASP